MDFKSVIPAAKRGGGKRKSEPATSIAYNVHKTGNNSECAVFYIGVKLCKKAGFIPGDYLDIQKSDCGEYGLIVRNNKGGRKLCGTSSKNVYKLATKKTDEFNRVDALVEIDDHVVESNSLIFAWPK